MRGSATGFVSSMLSDGFAACDLSVCNVICGVQKDTRYPCFQRDSWTKKVGVGAKSRGRVWPGFFFPRLSSPRCHQRGGCTLDEATAEQNSFRIGLVKKIGKSRGRRQKVGVGLSRLHDVCIRAHSLLNRPGNCCGMSTHRGLPITNSSSHPNHMVIGHCRSWYSPHSMRLRFGLGTGTPRRT